MWANQSWVSSDFSETWVFLLILSWRHTWCVCSAVRADLTFHHVLLFQDMANGKHLGTWSTGFPDLQVHHDDPLLASRVQCSLVFMAGGLQEILEDQKTNLNPEDSALHLELKDAVLSVNTLSHCLKEVLGGECQPKPSAPKMPQSVFARKQWSHTLLEDAKTYLGWLQHKLKSQNIKYKDKNTFKFIKSKYIRCLEGRGYMVKSFKHIIF